MWLDILMKSSTAEDVERYEHLMNFAPIEINLMVMAGNTKNLLLREFLHTLKVPKSTLTSVINRLEQRDYMKRVINPRDKRSFGLELTKKGQQFLVEYVAYQSEMGDKILKGLKEEEQQQLLYLLGKIAANVIPEQEKES
jgi:DNA-binding MarR family transcriptional regulator